LYFRVTECGTATCTHLSYKLFYKTNHRNDNGLLLLCSLEPTPWAQVHLARAASVKVDPAADDLGKGPSSVLMAV